MSLHHNISALSVNDPKSKDFHLPTYYYIVELVGLIFPILSAAIIILFPRYFQWITMPLTTMTAILFGFGLIEAIFLIFHEVTGRSFFFNINRYFFVVMYLLIILGTGGIDSSFIFLLVFPSIVSAVYLEGSTTRNIGIVVTVLFGSIIFLVPDETLTPHLVAQHIVQTLLIGIISFLMYRLVRETLQVRFEKDEAARRLAELTEIDRIKADFLSVAQHRLRTPLSGARFAMETVAEEPGLSEVARDIIVDGLGRIKDSIAIVNEMLKTAEGSQGAHIALVYSPVDLAKLLRDAVRELTFVASKNGNAVNVSLPQSKVIEADPLRLHPALLNILDNALRYTKNGQVSVSLSGDDPVELTVKDTGIGISEEDLPYIFDRLHRGHNAVEMDPDESGIGLYISKKIIELHGGTISIRSKLSQGTTVTVRLPRIHSPSLATAQ